MIKTKLRRKLVFRAPSPNECDTLWQLALRSKQHWGYDDDFINACRDELKVTPEKLAEPQNTYRIGIVEETIVGFYCLTDLQGKAGEVDALFLDPKFIGKGLGKYFWEDLIATGKQLGFSHFTIDSEPYAEQFYLKMGAIKVGETPSGSIEGRCIPQLEFQLSA